MTFYDQLVTATQTQRLALYTVPQLSDALRGAISVATYQAYLTQAFHHVKHTVRFLMAMGLRLPEEKQWLQKAITAYIEEEQGHEEWILNDIAATGGDKEAVRHSIPHLETQVLVAYNYDYIQRRNPVGFLGMVFMLESTSTQLATQGASTIQQALQLPADAFTYLQSHGTLDISHMAFFQQLVNQIDDPADQAAIIEVAQNTFILFANVLRSIPVFAEITTELKHAA
jgi:pyrroloquinoline quinone (PQQ) biosynthesis protein C